MMMNRVTSSTCVGDSLQFIGSCPEDSVVSSWVWVFESGELAYEQNPVYVFDNPGTYSVYLETWGSNNYFIGETYYEVTISAAPETASILGDLYACEEVMEYSVESPIDSLSYSWGYQGMDFTEEDGITTGVNWNNQSVYNGEAFLTLITSYSTNTNCYSDTTISILSCCNPNPDIVLLDGDTDLEATNQIGGDSLFLFKVISIEGVALSNNGMMGPQVSSNFASDNQWFDIDYDLYTNEGVDGLLSPFYVVGNDAVSFVPESSSYNIITSLMPVIELTTHNVIPCNYSYSCQNNSLTDSL